MKAESASLPKGADLLIIAPPGEANQQAVVLILNAEAMADGLPTIGKRQRVFVRVGKINHGRAEDRPVTAEQNPRCQPQLFLVAQVLDRGVDVSIEPQIPYLRVRLLRSDREVDLVTADGEIALVDSVPMGDVDETAVADPCSSHDVRNTVVKARTFRENIEVTP